MTSDRRTAPPPLEADDQLVTAVITAGWAAALVVVLVLRDQLPGSARWWLWTCVAGLVMGLFGLWYVPRMKHARDRAAQRRATAGGQEPAGPGDGTAGDGAGPPGGGIPADRSADGPAGR